MFQLTCRARSRGRGLVQVTPVQGAPDPANAGLDRWTIFIHGFNNSEKAATAIWSGTLEELLRRQLDLTAVVLFYWPGDYSRWAVSSAMHYPNTVPIAVDTARLLAEYLQHVAQDRPVPLQLSFVAHSLGSLVALETLRLLRNARANIIVDELLTMAAAVPEGFCVSGEDYGQAYSQETSEMVLYSLDDGVLKRFFQVGQEIADHFPENRRRAVGRTGGPGAGRGQRWSAAVHMDGLDHGDYWKNRTSIAEIAHIVAPRQDDYTPLSGRGLDSIPEDTLPFDVLGEHDYIPPEVTVRWLTRPHEL